MRTHKHIQAKARIVGFPFTFQCTACESVEHRRTPMLPAGWATVEAADDVYAYCGECAPVLPAGSVQ
ncbi:hypothetical protein [Novosphingobium pentaromativorans]|uniref:Uncharacterized protein n=1 Tax=Novosphingobium pentaromativorans US6-1 TaxID=1088721 RepID=G6EFG3_9SPHN|nr:hypothetical protein [Novosphingobium pentaromativorans]AIT79133.1 hypothetical protein JI59_04600 [Novosphingobium pentaromativorans US6-1]EHJ60008.1 hypothetical protein NSU_3084 [Novosphingobium pentaromativorans US6-1]